MTFEFLLCILLVLTFGLLVWLCHARLRFPQRFGESVSLTLHVTASGEAPELEIVLRDLLWLRENGLLSGEILLEDCGLAPQTAAMVSRLINNHSHLLYTREGGAPYGAAPGIDGAQREHRVHSLSK